MKLILDNYTSWRKILAKPDLKLLLFSRQRVKEKTKLKKD